MTICINRITTEEELHIAFEIRRKVFIEEQNVEENIEMDEFDKSSQHILAKINEEPIATARWRKTKHGLKLERFAVLKQFRGLKVGSELVLFCLEKNSTEKNIYLNAQEAVIPFYEKFGFRSEGKQFCEANIPHKKMVLQIR